MKTTITYFFLAAIVFLPLSTVYAQHGVSYNQFGQLRNSFNSSFSTMDERGSFSLLGRSQWVGVEGSPRSMWFTGNIGFERSHLSIGLDVKHAAMGVTKESEMTAYLAKAVRISEDEYLSLSMGGGLIYFQGNFNQLDASDPTFRDNISETDGVLSISTSYYKKDRYYFGVSMPRFSLVKEQNRDYEFRNLYYITGGAVFELDRDFHLRPSVLITHLDNLDPRYDVSLLLFLKKQFGLGMGVQNQGDLSALMHLYFGNFGVGYSYQFNAGSTTLNQRISTNTHEIGLRYRLGGMGLL